MIDRPGLGRFTEAARLVLAALRDEPRSAIPLFDAVRALDGPIGPGTLYAAIARLERRGIIEGHAGPDGRTTYRLVDRADRRDAVPGGVG